jgi:hypothetical protein
MCTSPTYTFNGRAVVLFGDCERDRSVVTTAETINIIDKTAYYRNSV